MWNKCKIFIGIMAIHLGIVLIYWGVSMQPLFQTTNIHHVTADRLSIKTTNQKESKL